jgi:hypothetical protein
MVNPILNQAELKHDLEVMLFEYKLSKDAFGQSPASSYLPNIDGYINLKNILNTALGEISRLRSKSAEGKVTSPSDNRG